MDAKQGRWPWLFTSMAAAVGAAGSRCKGKGVGMVSLPPDNDLAKERAAEM
jgi:hypothetical protein